MKEVLKMLNALSKVEPNSMALDLQHIKTVGIDAIIEKAKYYFPNHIIMSDGHGKYMAVYKNKSIS